MQAYGKIAASPTGRLATVIFGALLALCVARPSWSADSRGVLEVEGVYTEATTQAVPVAGRILFATTSEEGRVNRAELSVGAVSGAPYIVTLDDERDVLRSVGTGQLEILQVERKSRSETGADSWIFDVRITY